MIGNATSWRQGLGFLKTTSDYSKIRNSNKPVLPKSNGTEKKTLSKMLTLRLSVNLALVKDLNTTVDYSPW